jgi:demethylmenaquinone methyltransferase/2-methoxy-6-polyprenyl-1,4-benzoquinol methylase
MGLLELPGTGLLLDIGGGTGRVAAVLAERGQKVIIIDVSPGMLRQARGKPAIHPVLADAAALPFPSGTFPRALIVDALHHIPDQQGTILELGRTLAPGGVAVVVEPNTTNYFVKLIQLFEWLMFMHSHFLKDHELLRLFENLPGKTSLAPWIGNLLLQYRKT